MPKIHNVFGTRIANILTFYGYKRSEDLVGITKEELLAMRGISDKTANKILNWINNEKTK